MILIDDRVGSVDLADLIPTSLRELTRLDFGDACWEGRGAQDVPVSIGVERKNISDLISSMQTGRLSGHQMVGMLNTYDVIYVVVEGEWRPRPRNGLIEVRGKGKWYLLKLGAQTYMARDIWGYLNTLRMTLGVHIVNTGTPSETAKHLMSLHRWWTGKSWDGHKSQKAPVMLPRSVLVRPSTVRKVASQLAGVGWERSLPLARTFTTVAALVAATPDELEAVPGIGPKLASSIHKQLRGA